jgi:ribosomal protein L12E/L44/L45/RPP1/RPP2
VFELEDAETFETQTFQQGFTDDGTAVTLAGDAAAVSIQEVISQQADAGSAAAADAAGTEPAAADAADGQGKAAADAGSPTEDEALQMAVRARALHRLSNL